MKVQQAFKHKHPFTFSGNRLFNKMAKLCFASTLPVTVLSVANAETINQNPSGTEPATLTKRMFDRIDGDKNQKVDWSELTGTYEAQLERVSWNEETVMDNFDTNSNELLELEEYSNFVAGLRNETLRQSATIPSSDKQSSNAGKPRPAEIAGNGTVNIAQHDPHYTTVKEGSAAGITKDNEPRRHDYTKDMNASSREQQDLPDGNISSRPGTDSSVAKVKNANLVSLNGTSVDKEKIKGAEVKNLNNQKIGVVDEIVTNDTGEASGIVVDVGGIIGIGEKSVFVSATKVKVQGGEVVWETQMDEDAVERLPEYDEELVSSITN